MTPELYPTLAAHIRANTDPAVVAALAGGNHTELARLYNLPSTFVIWKADTSKSAIFSALSWAKMTPADAPDGSTLWTNRALACQGKQFNLQTMIISPGEALDMSENSIRTGIKDAIQNVPAGVGGALLDAGWAAVKTVSTRFAKVVEQVYATGNGTDASPGLLTFVGEVNINDIGRALNG